MSSAISLWSSCAHSIRTQVPTSVWQSTFNPAKPTSLVEDVLELTVPNDIIKNRLESEYKNILNEALSEASSSHITFKINTEQDADASIIAEIDESTLTISPQPQISLTQAVVQEAPRPLLHHNYTFDKFVTGSSNRFALAASLSVAENLGTSYNPLFIYGHAGLGKTHLLHAIGHYVLNHYKDNQKQPTKQVKYVSTEAFLNEFVNAIRTNTRNEFKQNYREVDVLLVDDIQFLENKEGLQEEFFHTFNSLYEANKQIVLTSDRSPDAISLLEERLTSRFKMGLITDIQPPDLETRLAILRKKADLLNLSDLLNSAANDEVLTFIATNITENIRELEGALNRITAYTSFNKVELTLDLAHHVLQDITTHKKLHAITPDHILNATSEVFSISIEDLIGPRRQRPIVKARQISMYVFRELTDLSYPDIARVFGNRDHTTAIHSVQKVTKQMAERQDTFNQVTMLIQHVKNT